MSCSFRRRVHAWLLLRASRCGYRVGENVSVAPGESYGMSAAAASSRVSQLPASG